MRISRGHSRCIAIALTRHLSTANRRSNYVPEPEAVCCEVPKIAISPPTNARPMQMATIVPPRITPAPADRTMRMPGILPLAPIATAPKTIVRKENRTPPQPNPMMVSAPSASNAAPAPPINSVKMAASTPKIPAMRAMIPPAFFMTGPPLERTPQRPHALPNRLKLHRRVGLPPAGDVAGNTSYGHALAHCSQRRPTPQS